MANHRADSTLDLPLEIAELIIDESALAGDKDTLRNIALASKRYTARCQQRLFHTIDLGDRCIPGGLYYRRLRTLLVRFPELGKLVRELRLVDTYVWDSEKEANWGWLIGEENLADILAALPNLTAFSLAFNAETPAWPTFAPPLRHALIQLAQRPKVHSFALNRISRFPPSLLVTLVAGVRALELIDVAVQEFSPAAPLEVLLGVAAIATPVVASLTLRAPKAGMLHVLRTVLAAAPLPTLTRLRVAAVDHTDVAAALELWSLLHWGAQTITQIEWLPAVRPLTPATCTSFSHFYLLQTQSTQRRPPQSTSPSSRASLPSNSSSTFTPLGPYSSTSFLCSRRSPRVRTSTGLSLNACLCATWSSSLARVTGPLSTPCSVPPRSMAYATSCLSRASAPRLRPSAMLRW